MKPNKCASPTIISEDVFEIISDMFFAKQYVILHRYLVEGGLMEGGIVAHLFLDPNTFIHGVIDKKNDDFHFSQIFQSF